MAQTKLNFTVSDYNPGDQQTGGNTADIPTTGGDSKIVTSSASEEPVTTEPKLTGSANTGFLTAESNSATISSSPQEPIIYGAFVFLGVVLLLAFVAKLKKKKQLGFKESMIKNRHTTAVLGFLSLLMIFAGVGGAASKYIGSSATSGELGDITTLGTVNASLVDPDNNLYCATDIVTINATTIPYGYMILMHTGEDEDTDGLLASNTSDVQNIASIENWNDLTVGSWGYFIGDLNSDNVYNPLPINYSVIANEADETRTTKIPVSFCAKIDKDIETASLSATVNYELLPREEDDIYPEINFNSEDDDDLDGLLNREENRYGMNPLSSDTDMDSLSDYEELKTYGTDPLVKDTDKDGLIDYSEVALSSTYGTDPLNPRSCTSASCDSTKLDGDQTYTYTEAGGDYSIPYTVTGVGNVPLTYIDAVNPVDIDESLENIAGTAYTFQSAGDVIDAEITVPYVQVSEELVGNVESDYAEELYGSVAITDDTITDDNTFAIAMTFEEDEDEETVQTIMNNTEKTINQENQTISIKVTDSQSILLVGNEDMDSEELTGGTTKSVFSKVKDIVQKTTTNIKTFLTGNNGGGNGTETWSVSSGFETWKDAFFVTNAYGYYDGKNYFYTEGLCYGISMLTNLLYTERINLNITHDIGWEIKAVDGKDHTKRITYDGKFSLAGLKKGTILRGTVKTIALTDLNEKMVPRSYIVGKQGRAIFALQNIQGFSSIAAQLYSEMGEKQYILLRRGPEYFINTIKNKIDKNGDDDPIVISGCDKTVCHSVNAYSLKAISKKGDVTSYELGIYDSNSSILKRKWNMNCSKNSCEITKATTLSAPFAPIHDYLKDPNYFMTH